jgi:hypothetical protein
MEATMIRGTIVLASVILFNPPLRAGYSSLVPVDDFSVYVRIQAGLGASKWYLVSPESARPVDAKIEDVANSSGQVVASSTYSAKSCGIQSSTCFLQPSCRASTRIQGIGRDWYVNGLSAMVRLDPSGSIAWISTLATCALATLTPAPPRLDGLYEPASLRQIVPSNGAELASKRFGRRAITSTGRALTFLGAQLQWLDRMGAHPIRHTHGALEAVTDSRGNNIAYVEAATGELHWISSTDEALGFTGSAPALTSDGRALLSLSPEGRLQIYEHTGAMLRTVTEDTYREFTLPRENSPGSLIAFAVTTEDRLVRLDLVTGSSMTLMEPYPEIQSMDAPQSSFFNSCPVYCYYEARPNFWAWGRGMVVILRGRHLDQPGWRAKGATFDVPLNPIWDGAAWLQAPSDLPVVSAARDVEIYHLDHPVRTKLGIATVDTAVVCLDTVHEDYTRSVSAEDPAVLGETVHITLTGLRGVEPVSDGQANPMDRPIDVVNPPSLYEGGFAEVIAFRLMPGAVGLQQLDLRIVRPPRSSTTTLFNIAAANTAGCTPPAVIE